MKANTHRQAVFWFIIPENLFFTKNKNVKIEVRENYLCVTLFSLGLWGTLNCRDEKSNVLFISLKVLLGLVGLCDSQHRSTRERYMQTLWNASAACLFLFSSYNIKVFEVQLCSHGKLQFCDCQLLRKKYKDKIGGEKKKHQNYAFVAYNNWLKDIQNF